MDTYLQKVLTILALDFQLVILHSNKLASLPSFEGVVVGVLSS